MFVGQISRVAQSGARVAMNHVYKTRSFATQREHCSNTPKSLEATPKWGEAIFGKSNETRLMLAVSGALGVVWNFTRYMATKEEVKELDHRIDTLDYKVGRKFDSIEQKIDGLKEILLQDARHKQTRDR